MRDRLAEWLEILDRFWVGFAAALAIAALGMGITLLAGQPGNSGIRVTPSAEPSYDGDIHISGAVANPGFYPFKGEDTLNDLFQAAGGVTNAQGLEGSEVRLSVGTQDAVQKVNVNKADSWLLEALPGIGPKTASDIIKYRSAQGPFRLLEDLLRVPGIGESTLNAIRDHATVAD